MAGKPSLPYATVIGGLNTEYGLEVTGLSVLPLGADTNTTIYHAQSATGTFFVKLKRGYHYDVALAVGEALQEAGISHIIAACRTLSGESWLRLENHTLTVYPYIEAEDGFSRPLSQAQWQQFGRTMAQVHAVPVPAALAAHLPTESFTSTWRTAVQTLYQQSRPTTGLDEPALEMVSLLQEHQSVVRQLLQRSETLATAVATSTQLRRLCHGNMHAGNVLVAGSKVFYLIDWDEAVLAPVERDLMFIGGGVGNTWTDPADTTAFYNGYGHANVNRALVAYYRTERAVEDIALYARELLEPAHHPAGDRYHVLAQFKAQFEPGGAASVALATKF